MSLYGEYCRPGLARLMEAVGLDAVYERAEGDRVWQRKGGDLVEVLDLVGGFGANLFGHYHPELVAEEQRLSEERVPILVQGSERAGAGRLAKALCERLGDYIVIFANSGAETVEAAMKHAWLENRRPIFWALRNSFHGKTLGAIQLTWSYRDPFTHWGPEVHFLDPEDVSALDLAKAEADNICGAFIEPIQGEGGINVLPDAFARTLAEICRQRNIPLILDEIQSGFGRTGSFLASASMPLEPDYICLSKALGGGIAKIGALLIKRNRFVEEFSISHTSTFAEDDRGCLIALKALEILDRDNLPARCEALGEHLLTSLNALRRRFPEQLREVRGKGLMVGVELQDLSDSPSNTIRMLSQQKYLGYVAAAYLLHVHRIRVLPTLSQPFTIRVQPSAYVSRADLNRFVEALASLCSALASADVTHLMGFSVGLAPAPIADHSEPRPFKREKARTDRRVGFVGHLIRPEHAILWDPSLQTFPIRKLEDHMSKQSHLLGPTIFDQINVASQTGDEVHLTFIGLYLTSQQIASALWSRDFGWIMEKIEAAIALARDSGCQVVGLGGYTSIVSRNCRRVKTPGIGLTSGNSLTVGMGIRALKNAAAKAGIDLGHATLGVVGATGNIARTYANMLAPLTAELTLIVRNTDSPRLASVVDAIRKSAPRIPITITDNPDSLRSCSLVIAASNSPGALIYPRHLAHDPVVICDLSLPSDVDESVARERPRTIVIQGGVVSLPRDEDFQIGGIPLSKGRVYACMAETLLMGLERLHSHGSYGPITPASVAWSLEMAEKHGFRLSELQGQRSY